MNLRKQTSLGSEVCKMFTEGAKSAKTTVIKAAKAVIGAPLVAVS